MGRVSMLMCCYNDADYVRGALECAFAQTLPDSQYEVVFVNDGSTDDTEQITLDFGERPNFVYLKHDRNLGLGAACTRALNAATGDYVTRVDADDTFDTRLIEKLRAPLDAGSTDFAYCDRLERSGVTSRAKRRDLAHFDVFSLIAAGTMMRRDLVAGVGGYRAVYWEEYDLYLRYLERSGCPPVHVPEALYTYVRRTGRITSDEQARAAGWDELRSLWAEETARRYGAPPAESGWAKSG